MPARWQDRNRLFKGCGSCSNAAHVCKLSGIDAALVNSDIDGGFAIIQIQVSHADGHYLSDIIQIVGARTFDPAIYAQNRPSEVHVQYAAPAPSPMVYRLRAAIPS